MDSFKHFAQKIFIVLVLITIIGIGIVWLREADHTDFIAAPPSANCNYMKPCDPKIDWFLARPRWNATIYNQLPNLKFMQWPPEAVAPYPAGRRVPPSRSIAPLPKPFDPTISSGQRRVFQELLAKFTAVMSDNGFGDRYFLTGGTLLGSFRHHDMIPWDDDVDILVDLSIRSEVRKLLSSLEPRYRFLVSGRDKFFTQLLNISDDDENDVLFSRQSTSYPWGWPFLDISYYYENDTHVVESTLAYGRSYAWPRDMVFPLYVRPLLGAWYPAPKNPLGVLILTYGKTAMCETSGYSHVLEKYGTSGSVICQTLGARYAFVQHRPCIVNGREIRQGSMMLIEERLVIMSLRKGISVIHTFCLAGDAIGANSDTYALDVKK